MRLIKRLFFAITALGMQMGCTGDSPTDVAFLETLGATDIGATSAQVSARLADEYLPIVSYGFFWGTSDNSQNTSIKGRKLFNNTYSSSLSGLSPNTRYWYRAFVETTNGTIVGSVKTFTTKSKEPASSGYIKFKIAGTSTIVRQSLTLRLGQSVFIYACYDEGYGAYKDGEYFASSEDTRIVSSASDYYEDKPSIVLTGVATGEVLVSLRLLHDGCSELRQPVTVKVQ